MPTPMAMATTMYHTRKNPLRKVTADSEVVETARSGKIRRTHKAFLRYQDPENWPILREALVAMGRADLIGNGDKHLIPAWSAGEASGAVPGGYAGKAAGKGGTSVAPAKLAGKPLRAGKSGVVAAAPAARGARANALTGSLTARQSQDSKPRASILDTIKVKKPAAPRGRK